MLCSKTIATLTHLCSQTYNQNSPHPKQNQRSTRNTNTSSQNNTQSETQRSNRGNNHLPYENYAPTLTIPLRGTSTSNCLQSWFKAWMLPIKRRFSCHRSSWSWAAAGALLVEDWALPKSISFNFGRTPDDNLDHFPNPSLCKNKASQPCETENTNTFDKYTRYSWRIGA